MRLVFPIREMYLDAFIRAQKHILLTNAYFIPDHTLLESLTEAAGRGVEVHVVLPGNPITFWRTGRRAVISRGACGLAYISGATGDDIIDAKTCTVDGIWSTIGTANLDRLSAVGNYEINVEIYSQKLAQSMETLFAADQTNAFEITAGFWQTPWYVKLSERILRPLQVLM